MSALLALALGQGDEAQFIQVELLPIHEKVHERTFIIDAVLSKRSFLARQLLVLLLQPEGVRGVQIERRRLHRFDAEESWAKVGSAA